MDKQVIKVVRSAWTSLLASRRLDRSSGREHFTDIEIDTGLLKDVEALNAILEPYLACPGAFESPPLSDEQCIKLMTEILLLRASLEDTSKNYAGFAATPYPYVAFDTDYTDSAADCLRLICNFVEFLDGILPRRIQPLVRRTAKAATSLLIDSCIEDKLGARWSGMAAYRAARYANLFFTSKAALALSRAGRTPLLREWISTRQLKSIDHLLGRTAEWTARQYDDTSHIVWSDEIRTSTQPASALCALEILYTSADGAYREICSEIAKWVVGKIDNLVSASSLQRDFFHTLPIPNREGVIFYDDRRYIGAFLGVFAEAIRKTPEVVTPDFNRACRVLIEGVGREWVDEVTGLWDDGRPLVCYSLDSLVSLVSYASSTGALIPAGDMRRLRIFLCHSSGDKSVARDLYRTLRMEGWDPWLDEEKLLPGQDWEHEILKAVQDSDLVIVCISRNSVNKTGYLQKEIKYALDVADQRPEGTIFIVPYRIDDCEVPRRLLRWQWVNAFDENGYSRLLAALRFRAKEIEGN